MSSPYDHRGSSRRRGVWTHWVPLAVTVTVATVGLAAWVWSQRNDDEEEAGPIQHDLDYENADYGDNPAYGATNRGGDNASIKPPPSFSTELREGETGYGTAQGHDAAAGWGSRMSGALRRTPSPQQFFDSAGRTVGAGVAAVGAAVGSALASIREDDKNAYADHETWSEEADAKKDRSATSSPKNGNQRRKVVAVVVSADSQSGDIDEDAFHEHAVSDTYNPLIYPQLWLISIVHR